MTTMKWKLAAIIGVCWYFHVQIRHSTIMTHWAIAAHHCVHCDPFWLSWLLHLIVVNLMFTRAIAWSRTIATIVAFMSCVILNAWPERLWNTTHLTTIQWQLHPMKIRLESHNKRFDKSDKIWSIWFESWAEKFKKLKDELNLNEFKTHRHHFLSLQIHFTCI